jgi:mono/diheme cytochrome c family protein
MCDRFRSNPYAWSVLASAVAFLALLAWAGASGADTSDRTRPELEQRFTGTVRPFLQSYCVACHGKNKPQAQLDLTAYASIASVARDYSHWSLVLDKLVAKQMPPTNAGKQPSVGQRDAIIAWIRAVRQEEEQRNAGDPGPVLARRLSNAEYDYTIRDLTGVDLRPTREFPVDPANQEGFDNSGESLTLSPALMKKYVQAAKEIADHLVLTSNGLEFASHPVLAETDRDKYCIFRIIDFYKRQPTDYADYFHAAWRYRYRAALGAPKTTLQAVAASAKLSPRYLELVWNTLTVTGEKAGPLATLQAQWNALPAPDKVHPDAARAGCDGLRDWVLGLRKKVACRFDNLRVPNGFSNGGQCFVLWKDRQYASHRRMLNSDALQVGGVPPTRVIPARRNRIRPQSPQTVTDPVDPELFVPQEESARAPYLTAYSRFCTVFPDAFYISERGRMFVDDPGDKGRLLTAGLHNSMGYFRDDTPLMELILDENGRRELNRLWLDFDTVAFVPERMHSEFFVYERAEAGTITDPEFNFARAEDKEALSDAKIKLLGDLYLAKARRNGGEPPALQAIEDHFRWVSTNIRATEKARLAAEPAHRQALLEFARRAYRRPLTEAERADLLVFYQSLRQKEGLSHEDAIRDSVVSVLMSPNFLFRLDLEASAGTSLNPRVPSGRSGAKHAPSLRTGMVGAGYPSLAGRAPSGRGVAALQRTEGIPPNSNGVQSLPDYALASRLSYFLWSSMPDEELLSHAAGGDLHRPEVLAAQARRMLRTPHVRALALEFGGNWLDFRRFEEHNAVDRQRFPSFNDDLREAMFEEPLRFMMDEFQNDRSVLELLYGKHTFVNTALARHYGMTDVKAVGSEWVRVANADRYGRGGLFPMAVFLTKNSPGLRTSPVKRGYWVVRRLLGEVIPPPPPIVPQLPSDESKMGDLTLRQALAQHRANPACAGCHARFDSYGLVFEGYGPIGELRTKDLGGKPVDARAPFPGGIERSGVTGLQDFVRQQRQKDFLDTLCRKLLSYGLGRSLQPSDNPTLQQMQQRLTSGGCRFGTLVETIVTSRQFRTRRTPTTLARN